MGQIMGPLGGQAGSLPDRLEAALEAVVISDRWVAHRQEALAGTSLAGAPEGWQAGLLRMAHDCLRGNLPLPHRWQTHFQTLPGPAAVMLNALPYLWLQADAHGHHQTAVARWIVELELLPAAATACEALFALLCQEMRAAGAGWGEASSSPPLGAALGLVAQSQGQFAVVLSSAHRRGWESAEVALAGLVVGLMGGRATLGAALRQRWLLDYVGPKPATLAPGRSEPDRWQNLGTEGLGAIAVGLHYRWAGREARAGFESPQSPLAIRV